MKKSIIIFSLLLSIISFNTQAQAFSARTFNVDVGAAIGSHGFGFLAPGVLVSLEKGVHDYVGVGAYAGYQYIGNYFGGLNSLPFGAFGSFHFYKLLENAIGKDIGSDKFDLAIKLSLGARFQVLNSNTITVPNYSAFNLDGGFSTLARYYFTDNFAIYGEVGYPAIGNLIIGFNIKL